jgi:hypothetical protein
LGGTEYVVAAASCAAIRLRLRVHNDIDNLSQFDAQRIFRLLNRLDSRISVLCDFTEVSSEILGRAMRRVVRLLIDSVPFGDCPGLRLSSLETLAGIVSRYSLLLAQRAGSYRLQHVGVTFKVAANYTAIR